MKKISTLLAALVMTIACLALPAAAATNDGVYTFEEYSLSVAVPDNFYVFTQDMDPEDPLFAKFSITYEDQMDYLTGDGAYNTILDITDALNTFDLCVDVYEDDSPDLTTYTQADLEALLESWLSVTYEGYEGLTILDSAVQTYNDIPYLTVAYSQEYEGYLYCTIDCLTIMNGYDYWFSLYSNIEEFSTSMKTLLPQLLSSVTYDGSPALLTEEGEPLTVFGDLTVDDSPGFVMVENPLVAEILDVLPDDTEVTDELVNTLDTVVTAVVTVLSILYGALCGLMPLISGLIKKQNVLAGVGFGVCILCGWLAGLLLALPMGAVLMVIILLRAKKKAQAEAAVEPEQAEEVPAVEAEQAEEAPAVEAEQAEEAPAEEAEQAGETPAEEAEQAEEAPAEEAEQAEEAQETPSEEAEPTSE